MIVTLLEIYNSTVHKIQHWVQVENTSWSDYLCLLSDLTSICGQTCAELELCISWNASTVPSVSSWRGKCYKNKQKKSPVSTGYVILDDSVCVMYKHVLLKENVSFVWFFPELRKTLSVYLFIVISICS